MRHTLVTVLILVAGCASTPAQQPARWWKGNLHTHSLWTDGADFPEMIAAWYQDHGYHFLGVTEHDMLQRGVRWVDINAPDPGWPPRNASARAALPAYRERFSTSWVEERIEDNKHLVRLRGLDEYRDLFERRDSFLLIMGEEVTDRGGAHINAFMLDTAVLPRGGANTVERIRNNLAAIGPRFAIVNHPNYLWALTPDSLAATPARFFEVYNGHRMVNNAGDSVHPSTDRMWDIILTTRHINNQPSIYGIANDDTHEYRTYSDTIAMPGRAWVMVRAQHLAPELLINAMNAGDFYASTGVTLTGLERDKRGIKLRIAAEPGVTYRTQFIGTRRNSNQIGEVLREVSGDSAHYEFRGDERYVRALIISSRRRTDPISKMQLELERAWVQPVMR